jgi:hypothetical protein
MDKVTGMKKSILAFAVSLVAISGFAHQTDCDYDVQGEFAFHSGDLRFFNEDNDRIVQINRDNQLYIDGNPQHLDANQQQLVSDYADQVRELVPLVFDLIVEGSEIGIEAATLALTTLFDGEDVDDLTDSLDDIRSELVDKIDPEHFSTQNFDDEDLEDQIEQTVKSALATLLPEVAAMAIRSVLAGDGEISQLEERAEKLEGLIEQRVEARADELEHKADSLCERLQDMDKLEDLLAEHDLGRIDFIEES